MARSEPIASWPAPLTTALCEPTKQGALVEKIVDFSDIMAMYVKLYTIFGVWIGILAAADKPNQKGGCLKRNLIRQCKDAVLANGTSVAPCK